MLRKMKYEIILNASYIQWSKTVVKESILRVDEKTKEVSV